jgi:hypothetical protein
MAKVRAWRSTVGIRIRTGIEMEVEVEIEMISIDMVETTMLPAKAR